MSETDGNPTESPAPPESGRRGVGLLAVALALPVLAGVVLLFVTSFGLAIGISAATVLVTSCLVAIDAHRLGNVDLTGRQRESAGLLFLGMCLLWIVVFPLAFFRRRHFGGPNLALPAILVAGFFFGGPILRAILIPPGLPACTSREVAQLFEQAIRGTPLGARVRSIDQHREVSYDSEANRRQGQCVVHTDGTDSVVNYIVEWQDRNKGMFQVRIPPADLPACASPEVVQLFDQAIRGTPLGAKVRSIDQHREVSYDSEGNRRQGQCDVHTDDAEIVVNYTVEWQDRDKGLFQVRIPPAELPACASREVVQVLEQVIRGTPVGAQAKSIEGHREVSYDRAADRRQGQCVVHTDGAEIVVHYNVEWQDRNKGLFQVRIIQ